ncbi:MAG: polyprenyl synthetase family protein [Acidobacteriota bacterium]
MQSSEHPAFNIEQYMRRQKELVDAHLDEILPRAGAYPEIIHEAMRYSVFAGGKRLRPLLALATGEALGGDHRRVLTLACALEMIHTYSLIHDDLPAMDNDDFRRGQPTAHKKFGEGLAILAGDGLLTLAFQVLTEIPMPAGQAEIKVKVIERIARAIGTSCGMLGGQVVDLTTEGKNFTREELDYIHSSKTGALIQASVESAALISDSPPDTIERIARFGARIGLAFQVVDDILDVEASSAELGKTAGKDRAGGKATYPALLGLEASKEIARKLVAEGADELDFLGEKAEVLKELARFISIRRF